MKNKDLAVINSFLKKHSFIKTNASFSEEWLGKSSRYYSMLAASGRNPSADGIIFLAETLRSRATLLKQHSGSHNSGIADELIQFSNNAIKELIPSLEL